MWNPPEYSLPGMNDMSLALALWQLPHATGPLIRYAPRFTIASSAAAAGKTAAALTVAAKISPEPHLIVISPPKTIGTIAKNGWKLTIVGPHCTQSSAAATRGAGCAGGRPED